MITPLDLDRLAHLAATTWLDWNPDDSYPVGCPQAVVDAVTSWAETWVALNRATPEALCECVCGHRWVAPARPDPVCPKCNSREV